MDIKELLKTLNLEGEENKDKASVLDKELKAKEKEFNELSKKNKELEEANAKLTADAEVLKGIKDKFDIVVKAFTLDTEAEDFDKMLDDIKDKWVKENGGSGTTPEDVKTLTRDLTKARRDLEKANAQVKEVTEQLEAEKNMRIDSMKKSAIKKELEAVNALNPEMFVDLFINKVSVDKDGKTLTMKDAAGNEISVADGVADWAKANENLIQKKVTGGLGSGGNGSGGTNDANTAFMKNFLANKNANRPGGTGENKTLAELFG